jgi:transcriptional antiterminator RfaH
VAVHSITDSGGDKAWYVVHTRTKTEHVAASMMSSLLGIETFCPRIRFKRATPRGKVWFIEALFPSYFFAFFDPVTELRAVKSSHNVLNLVNFGNQLAQVPEEVIAYLQQEMSGDAIKSLETPIKEGDLVEIAEGPMRGLSGIVHSLTTGEERVRVLLEILGSYRSVDVAVHSVVPPQSIRELLGQTNTGLGLIP